MTIELAVRFDWGTVGDFLFDPIILRALWQTIKIASLAMVLGIVLGIVLAVMRVSKNPLISIPAGLYVWFWRATPVILQLLMFYFGLRQLIEDDLFRDNWTRIRAAIIIFGLNEASYMAEIGRAGIKSVESGQMDAAKSLGMTNLQAMRRIILPQAVRVMIPPTGNEFIAMLKNTSVAFAIGVVELLNAAKIQAGQSFKVMEMYTVAAFWYLVVVTGFSFVQAEIEGIFSAAEREREETFMNRFLRVVGASRGDGGYVGSG
ncbi:MAG TPA: amino acid ABC transporter permease [Dehalococcoidia bacterium]|nr:amino acid ABC transporter permease [Dehalococcoidia bacterium]